MKRNFYSIYLLLSFLFLGCRDDIEHYEIPGTLGDRLVGAMEKQEDLKQFVKAIDKLEMREDLESSAYTVFPPTDQAVLKYIKDTYGVSDVDELEEEALKMLVRGHVVRNSLSWDQMRRLNRRGGWGDVPGEDGYNRSGSDWSFKLPSIYNPLPFVDVNQETSESVKLSRKTVYLPIMHYDRFSGLLEEDDYSFLFPDSEFTGFNVHGAVAVRPNQKTLNGFVHVIDRVIPILPNAEVFLATNEDYSLFYELLGRFSKYSFDRESTDKQLGEVKDSLFSKTYGDYQMDWIANDRPVGNNFDNALVNNLTVPTNEALEEYLMTNLVHDNAYGSIQEIPDDIIRLIVKNHCANVFRYAQMWLRPSQLKFFVTGNLELVKLDKTEVAYTNIVNNAVVYGLNKVLEPRMFSAATRHLVFDTEYSYMLKIAQKFNSTVTSLVTSPDRPSTVFLPSDRAFEQAGFSYDEQKDKFSYEHPFTGEAEELSDGELMRLLSMHLVSGTDYKDLDSRNFARTLSDGDYLIIKDGKIKSGGNYEMGTVNSVVLTDETGNNGTFYGIDHVLLPPSLSPSFYILDPNREDEYSEFVKLLDKAGYVDNGSITKLAGKRNITVLVPSNEAIERERAKIPEDEDALRTFIDYHFVQDATVLSDGALSGRFKTMLEPVKKEFENIWVENAPENLVFKDGKGNTAKVIENSRYSNILANGGTVHLIDNILLGE
ncbi:hypothetical protein FUAX_23980 [Fulvitalea axinellae]|uniref:FAS1 domain-containing protein n=1 Tax=Fulvitalea axinellae TaxID=1182444 RepID=A0AAU9CCV8_9BACT|nr:hypothetical protein FUAX_23980 [Fulvitalea axinellae]